MSANKTRTHHKQTTTAPRSDFNDHPSDRSTQILCNCTSIISNQRLPLVGRS